MRNKFRIIAGRISVWAGSAAVFAGAALIIIVWALTGPVLDFSNTWQLTINTTTTIVTFLMVFLIQNTQNRDGLAIQLKLDELIRSNKTARHSFMDLEDLTDDELAELTEEFKKLHEEYTPTPAMRKLHHKIEQAHAHRQNIRGAAGHMMDAMLDPLNGNKHKN
jgi:low affinity Fe/Cu permease